MPPPDTAESPPARTPPARNTSRVSRKREYIPPTLERLGTVRELTHGLGDNQRFDGSHPPGQNKSRLA